MLSLDWDVSAAIQTFAAATASASDVTDTEATLTGIVPTGGKRPYTYQWYRDTTPGFTPSGSNDIEGATSLVLEDSELTPETAYYYVLKATDALATVVSYAEVEVTTEAAP